MCDNQLVAFEPDNHERERQIIELKKATLKCAIAHLSQALFWRTFSNRRPNASSTVLRIC